MVEEITKIIGMAVLVCVIGYTFAQFVSQSTINVANQIKYQKKNIETFDNFAKEITTLKAEVSTLKKNLSISASPQKDLQNQQVKIAEVEQTLDAMNQRLKSLEALIIEDPQKAYGLISLQKNMELFKSQAEKDIKDVGEKFQKQSDRIDTLLFTIFGGLIGVVLLMLPSFIKGFRKPAHE